MNDFAEKRLKELREEQELGQKQLAMLEARSAELRNTLLRISGAIQVLEEVIQHGSATPHANGVTSEPPRAN